MWNLLKRRKGTTVHYATPAESSRRILLRQLAAISLFPIQNKNKNGSKKQI